MPPVRVGTVALSPGKLLLAQFCEPAILTWLLHSYSQTLPSPPKEAVSKEAVSKEAVSKEEVHRLFSHLVSESSQFAKAVVHLVHNQSDADRSWAMLEAFCSEASHPSMSALLREEACALLKAADATEDIQVIPSPACVPITAYAPLVISRACISCQALRRSLRLAQGLRVDAEELAAGREALRRLEREAEREARRASLGIGQLGYPDDFNCPITFCKMVDPVTASDGHSYEREAILAVIRSTRASPLTRERLALVVFPNHVLKRRIQAHEEEVLHAAELAVQAELTRSASIGETSSGVAKRPSYAATDHGSAASSKSARQ